MEGRRRVRAQRSIVAKNVDKKRILSVDEQANAHATYTRHKKHMVQQKQFPTRRTTEKNRSSLIEGNPVR